MTQVLATTVVVASLYALLAAGYVLVYRATRVLNLAQGDMMTLGGYFLFLLAAAAPGEAALSIATAAALSTLAGFCIYRLLMRPMAGHPIFAAVLVTVTLGLYLALGTLALHHVVLYVCGEFQNRWGANTGVSIPAPALGAWVPKGTTAWYYALTLVAALVLIPSVNLQRSRAGRAWMAIRDREIAAESVGIDVARYKVLAFVWSSALTSVAGALFAYQRAFVSVEAFGFFLAIEYITMIIIGGLGSALGAVLGAAFVTLLPYGIDAAVAGLRLAGGAEYYLFPLKFGAFGLLMAVFLIFEPQGLVGIWRRVRNWFVLWPLRYRPLRPAS